MTHIKMAAMLLITLAGCQKAGEPPAAAPPAKAAAPAPPAAITAQDWKSTVARTYIESNKKDEGDGVYTANACFDTEGKDPSESTKDGRNIPCPQQGMEVTRDGFRKITFFHPPVSKAMEVFRKYDGGGPYLGSYIALPDCDKPSYFLKPTFHGKSWLFMNKVALMVDGEIVLEHDFKGAKVKRDVDHGRVEERYDFIADAKDINGVQRIIGASQVLMRITGDKGYVSLSPKDAQSLQNDARRMKRVYEKLTEALAGKIPASCT